MEEFGFIPSRNKYIYNTYIYSLVYQLSPDFFRSCFSLVFFFFFFHPPITVSSRALFTALLTLVLVFTTVAVFLVVFTCKTRHNFCQVDSLWECALNPVKLSLHHLGLHKLNRKCMAWNLYPLTTCRIVLFTLLLQAYSLPSGI